MDDKLVESILNKSFEIICSEISLSNSDGVKYSGPGEIKINEEGDLTYKIFCTGQVPYHEVFSSFNAKPGQIIDDSEFYLLNAKDLAGNIWSANRIMKHINGGQEGYVVLGKIDELLLDKSLSIKFPNYFAKIIYPGKVDFPCNTPTEVKTKIGGKERGFSGSRNVSKFKACGYEFELQKNPDYFSVEFYSDKKPIPLSLISQVTETLFFIFAHSLSWAILEITEGQNQKLYLRCPLKEAKASRIQGPIPLNHLGRLNSIWILFDKYLSYLLSLTEESWKRIVYYTHSVIVSGLSTIEAEALTLAVSIEGILKKEFSDIILPSVSFIEEVVMLKDFIVRSDITEELKNRLTGSLNTMSQPSAKDRLRALNERGLLEKDLIRAWDKIRHSLAHGDEPDYTDFQAFLDYRGAVIVLYYKLIFLVIGYQGEYCDYGIHGYPMKIYDKKI